MMQKHVMETELLQEVGTATLLEEMEVSSSDSSEED